MISTKRSFNFRSLEKGQSTIEFVLTLILFMGFILFFSRLSLFLGYANFVQYATFMAARAYQSGANSETQQQERANAVIVNLLKKSEGLQGEERFGIGQGKVTIQRAENPTNDALSWEQGVRYDLRGKLFVKLFGVRPSPNQAGSAVQTEPGVLRLVSESWLGREPTAEECMQELRSRQIEWGDDNGC